jgi:tRNA-Thr(GGU) m(6)t(6)A37 methyltransferase TsaA
MNISMKPIGIVQSAIKDTKNMPVPGITAKIILDPKYSDGLLRIEKNSHLWVLSWFHESNRDHLISTPKKVDPNADAYGVFALRTPSRPNPIALTLVKLIEVGDHELLVSGMDAVDGTPVLDIKPYFEKDIVFAPMTPYIRPDDPKEHLEYLNLLALQHHGENCIDLEIAVKMAYVVEKKIGNLNDETLRLHVIGSFCFGDVMQGITRARLGNPERFTYVHSPDCYEIKWSKGEQSFKATYTEATGVLIS